MAKNEFYGNEGKYLITFCDEIKNKSSDISVAHGVFLNYL